MLRVTQPLSGTAGFDPGLSNSMTNAFCNCVMTAFPACPSHWGGKQIGRRERTRLSRAGPGAPTAGISRSSGLEQVEPGLRFVRVWLPFAGWEPALCHCHQAALAGKSSWVRAQAANPAFSRLSSCIETQSSLRICRVPQEATHGATKGGHGPCTSFLG